jgi:hypothetical protein
MYVIIVAHSRDYTEKSETDKTATEDVEKKAAQQVRVLTRCVFHVCLPDAR